MSLFKLQDIILHSGQPSNFKIECDALTYDDLQCLAWLGSQIVPEPFSEVVGIPRGGTRFAYAMSRYSTPGARRHLIVDDVWTTGNSFNKFDGQYIRERFYEVPTMGLVIFARSSVPTYRGVYTIFQLNGMIK